jgi:hypothetical protein
VVSFLFTFSFFTFVAVQHPDDKDVGGETRYPTVGNDMFCAAFWTFEAFTILAKLFQAGIQANCMATGKHLWSPEYLLTNRTFQISRRYIQSTCSHVCVQQKRFEMFARSKPVKNNTV